MLIGIKLDLGFAKDQEYLRLYEARDVLEYLKRIGIDAAETPIGPNVDADELIDHARGCIGAGLRVSLHPYTEGSPTNPALFEKEEGNSCCRAFERIFTLAARIADLQRAETVVNIHPAAAPSGTSRSFLKDQSVRFFEWILAWCNEKAPIVKPVAELQIGPDPDEPVQRIGDNLEELKEITDRSGIEACWDFGHGYMNTRRYGVPLDPMPDFLNRIAHVHCHDVDGEDHQPLIYGNVPWRRFLEVLMEKGYDGTVVLEIRPNNVRVAGGLPVLAETVQAVRSCIV